MDPLMLKITSLKVSNLRSTDFTPYIDRGIKMDPRDFGPKKNL